MLGDVYWTDEAGTVHIVDTRPKTALPLKMCKTSVVGESNSCRVVGCDVCVLEVSCTLAASNGL